MKAWYQAKQILEQASGISMDALHVLGGVVALLLFAALLRQTIASWRPWLAVLLIELLNEAADVAVEIWPDPWMQAGEAAKDVGLTMLLPTVLLLTGRFAPWLYAPRAAVRQETRSPS